MERINLFVGADAREAIGLHVFLESLWKHTSLPVDLTVLTPKLGERLGITSDGSNAFSTSRFWICELMNYAGHALFVDGVDMLVRADLAELWALKDKDYAVQVVKHEYKTKHPRKYVGTELEAENQDYPRKNQSSAMIFNCNHYLNKHGLNLRSLKDTLASYFHRFRWLTEDRIGELPAIWNHLVLEQPFNPEAKIAHFTLGQPGFNHYSESEYADEWKMAMQDAMAGMQYQITFNRG